MKECRTCSNTKPVTEFYSRKDSQDGFRNECKQCTSDRSRQYRDNNSVEVLPRKREYYHLNKHRTAEKHNEYMRIRRMRPDVQLRDQKYRQDYRETHREQIRDYNAKYKQTHAEQVRTDNAARRLRKLNVSSHMSQDDKALSIAYRKLIKNDVCFYCGQAKELMDDDHWIPLSRGGTDHWWNLVRACSKCNNRKNNKCGEHFINGETCNC